MQKKVRKQPVKKNRKLPAKYKRRRFTLILIGAVLLFGIFYGISVFLEKNTENQVVLGASLSENELQTKADSEPKLPDKPVTVENEETDLIVKIANANWQTVMVNKNYPLESDFKVDLEQVSVGMQLDKRIAKDFKLMLIDAKSVGMNIEVFSTYLTPNDQEEVYNNALNELLEKNKSLDVAKEYLSTRVPEPWATEHHTGLAVDISTPDIGKKNQFDQTPEFKWLMENAANYGFSLRYPKGKVAVTGYEYNPCHFRYVGTDIAKYLMTYGITLEEYIYLQEQKLNDNKILVSETDEVKDEDIDNEQKTETGTTEDREEKEQTGIEEEWK